MKNFLYLSCLLLLLLPAPACQAQEELTYKILDPRSNKSQPAPVLFLLHGWGSDENDLLDLSSSLPSGLVIISVRGPYRHQGGGYMWYDLQFGNGVFKEGLSQAAESSRRLSAFIPKMIAKYHLDSRKVFIGGFSQGGIMSLRLGLSVPFPARGLICLSGRFPPDLDLSKVPAVVKSKVRVFASHGHRDQVIPIADGRQVVQKLKAGGIAVHAKEYNMAHQISPEVLQDLKSWLLLYMNQ
ncbi:MAG: hypothetical protein JNL88_07760 [Bacteroidia bacterium]|nr:hypothetical protein [Bacteroidia bacterium]